MMFVTEDLYHELERQREDLAPMDWLEVTVNGEIITHHGFCSIRNDSEVVRQFTSLASTFLVATDSRFYQPYYTWLYQGVMYISTLVGGYAIRASTPLVETKLPEGGLFIPMKYGTRL